MSQILKVTWSSYHFHVTSCRINLSKYSITAIALLLIKIKIKKYGQCYRFCIQNYSLNWIRDILLRAIYICIYIMIIINKCEFNNKTLFKKFHRRVVWFFTKMHYFLINFYDFFYGWIFFYSVAAHDSLNTRVEHRLAQTASLCI